MAESCTKGTSSVCDAMLQQPESDLTAGDTIVTMATFSQLMTDPVFVDYFNVFLSLPVFAERVIYLRSQDRFEFTPPVTSPDLVPDKSRMMSWLYGERMPLFVRSELFTECVLCRRLLEHATRGAPSRPEQEPTPTFTKNHSSRRTRPGAEVDGAKTPKRTKPTKPKAPDVASQLTAAIGGVSRMRNFRRYLAVGPGRKLYDFWMDAERFFRIPATDERSRWLKYREIQITFCEFQAPTTAALRPPVDDSVERDKCIFLDGKGFVECRPFAKLGRSPLSTARDAVNPTQLVEYLRTGEQTSAPSGPEALSAGPQLRAVQRLLLVLLADYWLVKYAVHREARQRIGITVKALRPFGFDEWWTMEDEGGGNDETGSDTIEKTRTSKCREERLKLVKPTVDNSLQRDDEDVEENAEKVFVTYRVEVTETEEEAVGGRSVGAVPSSISVTSIVSGSTCSWLPSSYTLLGRPCDVDESLGDQERPVRPARRRLTFIQRRALRSSCTRYSESVERGRHTRPGVRGCGGGDDERTTVGSEPECHRTSSATCRKSRVPPDGGRNRPPPRGDGTSGDQLSVNHVVYRQNHDDYVRAVAADRAAGGPFESFLVERDCVEAKRILNFWSDAQIWLTTRSTRDTNVQSYISARRARALMVRYLTSSGDRRMCLIEPELRYSLQRHLANDEGDNLVRDAQVIAIEYLRRWWDSFCQNDITYFERVLVIVQHFQDQLGLQVIVDKDGRRKPEPAPKIVEQKTIGRAMILESKPKLGITHNAPPGGDAAGEIDAKTQLTYATERRCEIALQLAIETTNFCGCMI